MRIVETRHGLVLAAAGVDASNVARDELALLPVDPDASALALRDALRELLGVEVGVIISDTWAGPGATGSPTPRSASPGSPRSPTRAARSTRYGNTLDVTRVAVADEIAAAADLVKGKLGGIPVAVVRGLAPDGKLPDDGNGSRELVRDSADDLFRLGTAEAIALGARRGRATRWRPPLHADAVAVSARCRSPTRQAGAIRQAFLGFLAARPDAMWRSCAAGHLTASAVVLDPSRAAVLLTLHPRVGLWLQVGGHCEPGDHTLLDAAAREAREESGIGALSFDPTPLALDVHPITCSLGVPTRHFDVQFLAVAPAGAEPVRSDESIDLRWFAWDDLPAGIVARAARR